MLFIKALQELAEQHSVGHDLGFLISLAEAGDIGKHVDDNLGIEQETLFCFEIIKDRFPQISSSVMATNRSSLNVII